MINIWLQVIDTIRRHFDNSYTLRVLDSTSANVREIIIEYFIWNMTRPTWFDIQRIDHAGQQTYKGAFKYLHSDESGHFYVPIGNFFADMGMGYLSMGIRVKDIERSVLIGNKRSITLSLIGNYTPLSSYYEKLILTAHYDEEIPHRMISFNYHTIQFDGYKNPLS